MLEAFRDKGFGQGVHYIGDWTGRVGINHRVRAAVDAARDIIGVTAPSQTDSVGRWDSTRVVRVVFSAVLTLCTLGVAKARGYAVRRIGVVLALIFVILKKMKHTRILSTTN